MVCPSIPHTPLNPPPEHFGPYADTELSESAKEHYGNCTWFDALVGELPAFLDARQSSAHTLVVHVNDSGWEQPSFEEYLGDRIRYSNGGPKGRLSLHDLAFRTPVVLHWPGVIDPNTFRSEPVSTTDLFPTVLDYAGASPSSDLTGRSLRPLVEGRPFESREFLVGHVTQLRSETDVMGRHAEGYWLRTPRWPFAWYSDADGMALFDMEADPGAERNVAAAHGELAASFGEEIVAWKAESLNGARALLRGSTGAPAEE